ncbi:UDP-N-acetylglucosamine 1-carboxyvinyltransferase [Candidatus Aerophobetes bacterium]|uniref:UDP-N-acetylglucosamine 1-carboxyvinyltransferase n=1 Tax=Aerophobetes bacterium TaxID=2030807 RepID=A0A2A4WZC5_UNCAE|nr:MAG: UDP-N-acetylglucosamine 1-carboxyvinyltransferase [Candidatus Aerophobetes bacterium]
MYTSPSLDHLEIMGNHPLNGEVQIRGAKNAISKLLVASMLSSHLHTFFNVPNIQEVEITLQLCKAAGMQAYWDREDGVITAQTKQITSATIPMSFSGSNRLPILLLGALLTRTRETITIPALGGCNIGKRSIDFHLLALRALGAEIEEVQTGKGFVYKARNAQGLTGTTINLPYPSVMATENAILAATHAEGETVIKNGAIEPEVSNLILFLQKIGVNISIKENRSIHVQKTTHFHPTEHFVVTDRIEAASYGMAAIATKGRVFVKGAKKQDMTSFLNALRSSGGEFKTFDEGIEFFYTKPLIGGVHIETDVHPGFLTDWQQPFAVLLTQAKKPSIIHETVYENRFGYIEALREMGVKAQLFTDCLGPSTCRFHGKNHLHSLIIQGGATLKGGNIQIPDLRAGFAYVMAALIAPEKSHLFGLNYLERGYECVAKKLITLGAKCKKVTAKEPLPAVAAV